MTKQSLRLVTVVAVGRKRCRFLSVTGACCALAFCLPAARAAEPWPAPAVAASGLPRFGRVGIVLDYANLKYNPCNDVIEPSPGPTLEQPDFRFVGSGLGEQGGAPGRAISYPRGAASGQSVQTAQEINRQLLVETDFDQLVNPFQHVAGLPSPLEKLDQGHYAYTGHTAGHYLSACHLHYRNTGDVEVEEESRCRGRRVGAVSGSRRHGVSGRVSRKQVWRSARGIACTRSTRDCWTCGCWRTTNRRARV